MDWLGLPLFLSFLVLVFMGVKSNKVEQEMYVKYNFPMWNYGYFKHRKLMKALSDEDKIVYKQRNKKYRRVQLYTVLFVIIYSITAGIIKEHYKQPDLELKQATKSIKCAASAEFSYKGDTLFVSETTGQAYELKYVFSQKSEYPVNRSYAIVDLKEYRNQLKERGVLKSHPENNAHPVVNDKMTIISSVSDQKLIYQLFKPSYASYCVLIISDSYNNILAKQIIGGNDQCSGNVKLLFPSKKNSIFDFVTVTECASTKTIQMVKFWKATKLDR